MRSDINVWVRQEWRNVLEIAARMPFLGPATWKEGSKRRIPGQVVGFRAFLGADGAGIPTWFVIFWPEEGGEPLILATTLPVRNLVDAQNMLRLYEKRWAIEIGFQQLKGSFGLGKFMVRAWTAVERRLNLVALAYLVLFLLMYHYPGLTHEDIRACLAYASALLRAEKVYPLTLTEA